MINIRPITDLKNKYSEIEDTVLKNGEVVYLTKNGYGSMALISLSDYSGLMDEVDIRKQFETKVQSNTRTQNNTRTQDKTTFILNDDEY